MHKQTSEVSHESGTGVVANRKPLTNTNCDTQSLDENTSAYRGDAVSPAAPQICEGGYGYNPPVHDGLTLERLISSVERAEEHAPAEDSGDEDEDDESTDSATSREMYQSQFGDGGRYR
jgi:hypothetical protein